MQNAGAELNPIIDDLVIEINANGYSTGETMSTKLSTRAQFWYDKITPMQVSSKYQKSKNAFLLSLLDMKAHNGEWTTEALNKDKVTGYRQITSTSSTSQSTYQQTMAVTPTSPTLQSANDDQTFINAVERSGADLNPIIDNLSNAINANDYSTSGTLGFDLSAHAQFWYNKIDAMQVSSNYQDQKNTYLQALLDKKANGDDWASDSSHHGAKVPSTSPTVQMTYRQTVTVQTTLQSTYQQTVAVSTPSQVNSLGVTAAPTIQSIPSTIQIVNGNTRNPQEYIPLSIDGFSSDRGLESPIDNSLMEGGTTAIIVSYDPKTNSKYFGQFEYLVIQVYGFKNENLAEKTYQAVYKCDQPLTISGKQVTYEFDKSHGQTNICWRDKNNIILVGTGAINRNSPNEQAQKGANIYAAELVIQRAP